MRRPNLPTKDVSIEQRIQQFRREHPDRKPLILIDLMHLDKIHNDRYLERRWRNICGPNLAELADIKSLLRFLHDQLQCQLVSFVDGPDNQDLHEEQFSEYRTGRKDDRYARDITIIDDLVASNGDFRGLQGHVPTDRILFDSIVKLAKEYGRVVYALRNTRSMEMSRFAWDHQETVAGVLGKSSSILLTTDLLPSSELRLWYIPELNVNSMTVTELHARKVWNEMNLLSKKKRLLMAALLPGSYVGNHAASENIQEIYSFVRGLPSNIGEVQYRAVVERLFAGTDTTWEQLKLACELYDVTGITPSEQTHDQLTSFAHDIVHDRTSIITVMLNDYRYWKDKRNVDFYQLVVRFYGRLAGVVLKRNGSFEEPSTKRRIKIKRSHEVAFGREMIDVEFPAFDVTAVSNFECLKFILDFEDVTAIRRFVEAPENRWKMLDFVTVQYMIKEGMIEQRLADAIMQTVEDCPTENVELVDRLDMDAFHATFMYVRWRYYVREALANSGFPEDYIDDMCRLDGSRLQALVQQL